MQMQLSDQSAIETQLDQLEQDGFVLISQALNPQEVEKVRAGLESARQQSWQNAVSDVGSLWFDNLLEQAPDTFGSLVAHQSVRSHLDLLAGPQLQLRSFRGHIYPGPYNQQWHMDFYGYWQQPKRRYSSTGVGIQTTFYLQDNDPSQGYLKFIKGGHLSEPPGLQRSRFRGSKPNEFTRWCEQQEHTTLHPKAGDCVLFFSHIPHKGGKEDPRMERSNIVCHYQVNPFYRGLWFVSSTFNDTCMFPLA